MECELSSRLTSCNHTDTVRCVKYDPLPKICIYMQSRNGMRFSSSGNRSLCHEQADVTQSRKYADMQTPISAYNKLYLKKK